MTCWSTRRRIEFHHCDPAGIVYYPRYFEMLHSVLEEYFRDHLGYDYRDMHQQALRDVMQARVRVDFTATGNLGEDLDFAVRQVERGTTDMQLEITCSSGGAIRFTAGSMLVHTDLAAERQPCPWPDRIGSGQAGGGADA